ncbi:patatin-like phospholipase family protein [Paraclostridium bifermentans]|uniref:patatin-like phospholipase family protein n=1 Tax=Paraclostridium TaxID=1849822 RepID=UPI00038DB26A|nr:patatin family protein [Paraclostridium bifermentans]MDV8115159.1 patatin family protein [Bacillus sp. BAU-SS-2023]EQK45015.1 patatin-like phospholipase family protein [[Clostridium] bifermentans ATCC 19299] [Paraclostridium bifermentans ATCC 19299]MCE9677061.1 patatin family protein [Paraclostridium bifermentans]TQO57038.1 patatin family protein [Paraclostridium bifermentans]UOW68287.1 patatin family protein [Paraclostridium bifermentans]
MNKIGLILEGGGMRGIYTAGVLDFFIEKNIEVDITIGVSAGSCHASSYLSKQYKRAYNATVDYINDKRYLSFSNLIKTGSIFGMDFMFNKIPNELNIYDYDTFAKSKSKFVVVATNCETGSPEYFELKDLKKEIIYMQASCSIPMFANIVEIDDFKLVDGGVSDSIPIEYSLNQGYKKNIVVLTRDITYKKNKQKFLPIVNKKYKKYPNLVKAIENRHLNYNKSLNLVNKLEKDGDVLVIRPKKPVNVSQIEKNAKKLTALYEEGYDDAKELYDKILDFIKK